MARLQGRYCTQEGLSSRLSVLRGSRFHSPAGGAVGGDREGVGQSRSLGPRACWYWGGLSGARSKLACKHTYLLHRPPRTSTTCKSRQVEGRYHHPRVDVPTD